MPLLETHGLGKRFGPVQALIDVDLAAAAGEIRAIVGANGAGKSTLMKLVAGEFPPSTGEIRIDGVRVAFGSPRDAAAAGVAIVYQELSALPQLSVADNIYLGHEPVTPWGSIDAKRRNRDVRTLLDDYHLALDLDAQVGSLGVAQQQLVEIARALSLTPRILILDEPTALLSLPEQRNLFDIIGRLKARGLLILYVSHRLEEIFAIADRVSVLRDGRVIGTMEIAETSPDALVQMMSGRAASKARDGGGTAASDEPPLLQVDFADDRHSKPLKVWRGEIVGLAGMVGSGRSALARALVGLGRFRELDMSLAGERVRLLSPRQALAKGIVYITEDRKLEGLFQGLPVAANTTASILDRLSRAGILDWRTEAELSQEQLDRLRLVAPSLAAPVGQLSGGNQQKVLLARALLTRPRLLICDEPTRGIDIASRGEIYLILRDLAQSGVGIIVISSEIQELLAIADRIAVVRGGRIVADLPNTGLDEEHVVRTALGLTPNQVAAGSAG